MRVFKSSSTMLLLMLLFCQQSFAQVENQISEAANAYARAQINQDFESLLNFTYPDIIEQAGNRDAMKKTLELIKENQRKNGIQLQIVKIKDAITYTKVGNEIHAVVPITTISKAPGGKLIQDTYLIAVGEAGESHWYFIETTLLNERNLPKVLPNWDNSLLLPSKQAPIYKEDK